MYPNVSGQFGMNGTVAGFVAFACLFSAALVGALVKESLPSFILTTPVLGLIRRAVAVVTIMAAIMLAATTVYLKTNFDTANRDVRAFSFQIIDLDHTLRRIGPNGEPARALLYRFAARTMKDVWPGSKPRLGPDDLHAATIYIQLESAVTDLVATDEQGRELNRYARELLRDVGRARWTLDERTGRIISSWTLVILVLWFTLTFGGLGLSAQRSRVALMVLGVFAAALASAVFLAVEYADPYEGVIIVSSEPMRNALFAISD